MLLVSSRPASTVNKVTTLSYYFAVLLLKFAFDLIYLFLATIHEVSLACFGRICTFLKVFAFQVSQLLSYSFSANKKKIWKKSSSSMMNKSSQKYGDLVSQLKLLKVSFMLSLPLYDPTKLRPFFTSLYVRP